MTGRRSGFWTDGGPQAALEQITGAAMMCAVVASALYLLVALLELVQNWALDQALARVAAL